jgi:hypothetical protein
MRSLGPREREAPALVEERPGITVEELADNVASILSRMGPAVDRRVFG